MFFSKGNSELRSVVVWKIGNERYAKGKGFEG